MLPDVTSQVRWGRRAIKEIIAQKVRPYQVRRPTTITTDEGYVEEEVIALDVNAYLYEPSQTRLQTDFGRRLDGDLLGYLPTEEDIQVGDVVKYGAHLYEVDTIVPVKDMEFTDYQRISLVKRQEDELPQGIFGQTTFGSPNG